MHCAERGYRGAPPPATRCNGIPSCWKWGKRRRLFSREKSSYLAAYKCVLFSCKGILTVDLLRYRESRISRCSSFYYPLQSVHRRVEGVAADLDRTLGNVIPDADPIASIHRKEPKMKT